MALSVGLDLCDDYTIAYGYEDKSVVNVPTVICREKKDDLWYIGESAYRVALSGKGVLTDKLLSLLKKGGTSTIARKPYTAEQLLARLLAAVFWQLLNGRSLGEISRLVIALHTVEREEMESVVNAAVTVGIDRSKITVISHSDAFVYYTMAQSKDMYTNMAALFDLSDESLSFYRMKAIRGMNRNSVVAEGSDLEESFRTGILKTEAGSELGDRIMTDAAKRCLGSDIYSSVMLTGKGFERTDWAKNFLELICRKRRVIYEIGLFAIGAAEYAGMLSEGRAVPYQIFSDTSIAAEISMQFSFGERSSKLVLVPAGQAWYDAGAYVEVVPRGQDYIDIEIEPVDKFSVKKEARVPLDSFPRRPDRCTRASVELSFSDADTMDITVKDLGFGELFPSEDAVITEQIRLSGEDGSE